MSELNPKKIFIVTGETSGDLFASQLAKELLCRNQGLEISGVCGPKMRALGLKSWIPMEKFETVSPMFILFLPALWLHFCRLVKIILKQNPAVCILVDASLLNLQLARKLRERGYKGQLLKYSCPGLHWRDAGRKEALIQNFNALICLLPGETEHFESTSLKTYYFGHPVFQGTQRKRGQKDVLGFFPGSRLIELRFGFKKMLEACFKFQKQYPNFEIQIAIASTQCREWIAKHMNHVGPLLKAPQEVFANARIALAKPGVNNLELALHGIPSIIAFPLNPFIRWVAQKWFKGSSTYHSLLNQLLGHEVMPELLLVNQFSPTRAAHGLHELLDTSKHNLIQKECKLLSSRLDGAEHFEQVAGVVLKHALLADSNTPAAEA